jgi:hypothetical protein
MSEFAGPHGLCECGQAVLVPQRSVPVSGFSKDLRLMPDVERYWFPFALQGEVAWPVHVIFSPSLARAEVKAADLKVMAIGGVVSVCEAQRRWIAWWRRGRPAAPRFAVPQRTGRHPHPSPAAS